MSDSDGRNGPYFPQMVANRWEHGSEFPLPSPHSEDHSSADAPWAAMASGSQPALYGSGRDALRGLLEFGVANHGWSRLWVPDYLCPDVVAALSVIDLKLVSYPDLPTAGAASLETIAFQSGDVLMVVNQFGVRNEPDYASPRSCRVQVIEDHTHAPWSKWAQTSTADYCLASLRKVLPIPDGGVLWSPIDQQLPRQVALTTTHERAAHQKVAAMALKAQYLAGGADCKAVFRALAMAGEQRMCGEVASGMSAYSESLMASFPVSAWSRIRVENHQTLCGAIGEIEGVMSLGDADSADIMSYILLCRSRTERDALRSHLIQNRIYAAILWDLDVESPVEISPESGSFGRRMLSIHCDMRYSRNDMMRVGDVVRRFFNGLSYR